MKMLEAVIRCNKAEDVLNALLAQGIEGATLIDVRGIGRERPKSEMYRGIEHSDCTLSRVKLEVAVNDDDLDNAIDAVLLGAFTGKVGDGRIFITDLQSVIHIRTAEQQGSHLLENCG